MTRRCEGIQASVLDELSKRTLAAKAKGGSTGLKKLLIAELKLQQEADWGLVQGDETTKIEASIKSLESVAALSTEEYREYQFKRKWGIEEEDSAPLWKIFVERERCQDYSFAKIIENNVDEIDSMYIAPHYQKINGKKHNSQVADNKETLLNGEIRSPEIINENEKERQNEKHALLCNEIKYWNERNLIKFFVEYLASLSKDNCIRIRNKIVTKNIIADFVNEFINDVREENSYDAIDAELLQDKIIEKLSCILAVKSGGDRSNEIFTTTNPQFQDVKIAFDELLKKSDENQVARSYQEYVKLIRKIQQDYSAQLEIERIAKEAAKQIAAEKRGRKIGYMFSGAGAGMIIGIAAIVSLAVFAVGSVPVLLCALIGIPFLIAVGVAIGYNNAQRVNDNLEVASQPPSTSDTSSFLKTCSTAFCAVFVGLGSCCYAGDIDVADSQDRDEQSDVCDYDTADEVELSVFSVSAKTSNLR